MTPDTHFFKCVYSEKSFGWFNRNLITLNKYFVALAKKNCKFNNWIYLTKSFLRINEYFVKLTKIRLNRLESFVYPKKDCLNQTNFFLNVHNSVLCN